MVQILRMLPLQQAAAVADFQILNNFLYILCAVLGTNQSGILCINDNQIFHANCCNQFVLAADGAPLVLTVITSPSM